MIDIVTISAPEFETHLEKFDKDIDTVRQQFGVEIKSYGHILRIALNTLQPESFDNLLNRVLINRELENALDFAGGYTLEYLGDKNPKQGLINIINFLMTEQPKLSALIDYLEECNENILVIADINDIDFLEGTTSLSQAEFITTAELKKIDIQDQWLVFYSFNGVRDFDFIYHLPADQIALVLYEQESQLYWKQVQRRKSLLEQEIASNDREQICGIKYIPIADLHVNISQSIETIVSKIDAYNSRSYNDYKEESDSLLDEMEEKIIYKLTFDSNESAYLDSNETVYNKAGDLMKAYRIKDGDNIRIYPREELAEKVYDVALQIAPESFEKIEEHTSFWKKAINELRSKHGSDILYDKLKQKGLKVKQVTVDTYGKGYRKFPMYKGDIRAIIELYYSDKKCDNLEELIKNILNSKSTYNKTMKILKRGIRKEIRLFLKERQMGEILEKLNFTNATLETFINEHMPLQTIASKEIYNEQEEILSLFEEIEL